MKLTLKKKIIMLAALAALLPVVLVFLLISILKDPANERISSELDKITGDNIAQVAGDMFSLCKTSHELLSRQIGQSVKTTQMYIDKKGGIAPGKKQANWSARNQDTRNMEPVSLPEMLFAGTPFSPQDKDSAGMLVDEIRRFAGMECSIAQRMNQRGDMLCVASSKILPDGSRAGFDTFIPAVHQNGSPDPVVADVLQGKNVTRFTFAVGINYLVQYFPLLDAGNSVIGMVAVGAELEGMKAVRQNIMDIKIGKSGYVAVLAAKGAKRGQYVISKDGKRDGENIWEARSGADGRPFVQNIITTALRNPQGAVGFERYLWSNTEAEQPRSKVAAVTYFEPWDWVIVASMYEEDYYGAKHEARMALQKLMIYLLIGAVLIEICIIIAAVYLAGRMTRPLGLVIGVAGSIASGDVHEAKERLAPFTEKLDGTTAHGQDNDETGQLLSAFHSMTHSIDALISQMQRSGIQVMTSATEIAASARQLEATVAEQAASTREVTATTRSIAATSDELVGTMEAVSGTVGETADMAESGRASLARMENAMRQLMAATGTISSRLSIINDKANKISSVITTINKISDQTNLLSLNAAIEAEKAGEYGRGFSVVAREISRLADQTAIATQDIEHMVREMQSSVSSGVMEMDKFADEVRSGVAEVESVGGHLEQIINQVHELGPRFDTVKNGMHAQAESAGQITEAMSQLSIAVDKTRESLHEFKLVTDQLNGAVQGLQQQVSRFKIAG